MILTAQQARDIRNADAVCFDHDGEVSRIRAIYRADDARGTGEITVTIPLDNARIECYDGQRGAHVTCFDMVMSAQHVPEWRTVCKRLRSGSDVRLLWVRGNSSPVTRDAGLVVDYLNVIVNGEHYRVGNYVGLDNSARMVRVL
jgi:hypothetical protein